MDSKEYQEATKRTLPDPTRVHDRYLSSAKLIAGLSEGVGEKTALMLLTHAAIGLSGEAGELCSLVQKAAWYGNPITVGQLKEELGDALWYVCEACTALGLELGDVMAHNVAKLRRRYPEGFSEQAAVERKDVVGVSSTTVASEHTSILEEARQAYAPLTSLNRLLSGKFTFAELAQMGEENRAHLTQALTKFNLKRIGTYRAENEQEITILRSTWDGQYESCTECGEDYPRADLVLLDETKCLKCRNRSQECPS